MNDYASGKPFDLVPLIEGPGHVRDGACPCEPETVLRSDPRHANLAAGLDDFRDCDWIRLHRAVAVCPACHTIFGDTEGGNDERP
jgi:hypothetical protein